jgi:Spy/CpxP family protein refolding chaperone
MSIHKDGPYSAEWIAAAGLNLTAEQNARIRTMEEKWTRQFEPLQSRWYETRKELKAEWLKTEIDRRRIDVLQDEVAGLRERMREKIADRRAEVLEILTAEQRARVEDAEQIRDVYHNWIWYRTTRERR